MLAEDSAAPSGLKERCAYFRNPFSSTDTLTRAKQGTVIDSSDTYNDTTMSFEWSPDTARLNHPLGGGLRMQKRGIAEYGRQIA